jgi:hypothetical protein
MADDRKRFVVIAAGYREPMQRFVNSNSGLKSRFTTTIELTASTPAELAPIADLMASHTSNALTDGGRAARRHVLQQFNTTGELNSPTFGDGRCIRCRPWAFQLATTDYLVNPQIE